MERTRVPVGSIERVRSSTGVKLSNRPLSAENTPSTMPVQPTREKLGISWSKRSLSTPTEVTGSKGPAITRDRSPGVMWSRREFSTPVSVNAAEGSDFSQGNTGAGLEHSGSTRELPPPMFTHGILTESQL